jgi:hypothetical protein
MPVRSTTAAMTVAASSAAATEAKMPPCRPTGVRSGSQITASRIEPSLQKEKREMCSATQAGLPSPSISIVVRKVT